jgi:VIT1/CCC1 family predicted Fe2+/Mn2+ transporter
MSRLRTHPERHNASRIGWLRAAVLGANDGLVSTASLVVGVAAAAPGPGAVLVAGVAGTVAGAMSMAAGEYVSVSSQSDAEQADLARERAELKASPEAELAELAGFYRERGLDPATAREVARQLTAHDALGAHARDELGITDLSLARPLQAAVASALAFTVGALGPVALAALVPASRLAAVLIPSALVLLAALGALGAWAGGAPPARAALRVAFWGGFAMALTWAVGRLFGGAV